jgi:hypothetical protein
VLPSAPRAERTDKCAICHADLPPPSADPAPAHGQMLDHKPVTVAGYTEASAETDQARMRVSSRRRHLRRTDPFIPVPGRLDRNAAGCMVQAIDHGETESPMWRAGDVQIAGAEGMVTAAGHGSGCDQDSQASWSTGVKLIAQRVPLSPNVAVFHAPVQARSRVQPLHHRCCSQSIAPYPAGGWRERTIRGPVCFDFSRNQERVNVADVTRA